MKAKRMKEKDSKKKKDRKNNNHRKAIIILVIILLLIAILGTAGFFIYKNLDNNENEEIGLLDNRKVFGMELKNISIEEEDGVYVFKAQVENTLKEKFEKQPVQIIFRDEKSQKIIKYQYMIEDLEKGETQNIEIKTSEPLNEFYTFEIKKVV